MCANVLGIILSSLLYELLFEVHDDEENCSPENINCESKKQSSSRATVKSSAIHPSLQIIIMLSNQYEKTIIIKYNNTYHKLVTHILQYWLELLYCMYCLFHHNICTHKRTYKYILLIRLSTTYQAVKNQLPGPLYVTDQKHSLFNQIYIYYVPAAKFYL